MALRALLGALALLALPFHAARAQGLLTWERVGDLHLKVNALAFDGAGRLHAMTSDGAYRLDLSGGFPGVWEERYCCTSGDAMIGLGPDTLVATTDGLTRRSTDGGLTWVNTRTAGSGDAFGLHEAPPGTPHAGTLFVAGFPFAASTDRGATWEDRGPIPGLGARPTAFVTLPFGSAHPGRLVASALWGAAYSDDGGWVWETSGLWGFNRFKTDAIARTESPGGGERVLVVGVDATAPHVRAWYSDDGGETWLPEAGHPLPELLDGVGAGRTSGAWGLGGSRAVAVLGRGSVYGTEDGGETWSEVGQVPDTNEATYVKTSLVGVDGRLYVALVRIGSQPGNSGVYRTVERLATAAEPGPGPGEEGPLGLAVRPNPARGAAEVALVLPEAGEAEVSVYDVLGRRVAVLHEGPLAAGRHALRLDGAALPSGVYVVRVEAGVAVAARTVTLLR